MPLNAFGWSPEEEGKLAELVEPHPFLYNVQDPSRKNILAREHTWLEIAQALSKPVEECKKRWRGLRDSYMRCKRVGAMHKTKTDLFRQLQFLDGVDGSDPLDYVETQEPSEILGTEQNVITDNQEYYEITVVDGPHHQEQVELEMKPSPVKPDIIQAAQAKKIENKNRGGRKRSLPMPRNIAPIKILPKPVLMNGPKIVHYIEDPKTEKTREQRSYTIDKLIEKVLKEHTNEIDVFFRSMAASVKKLQPNLIPKVKMEVCNVIAKYEMQSFEKNM